MKDPLRDSRVTTKKKTKKTPVVETTSDSQTLLWLVGVIVLVVIIYFGYNYIQQNNQPTPVNTEEAEFEQQKETLERFESVTTSSTESQRDQKFESFFEVTE